MRWTSDLSSNLNLGWLIASILIIILGGYVGIRDRRAKKWRDLYELADSERKEIQRKLDEAMAVVVEQKEIITKLDALQMPIKIVELMNSSVIRIDENANKRLDRALEILTEKLARIEQHQVESLELHDLRATERHEKLIATLERLLVR